MTYCRFGVARVQLEIISEVCLKQILQTLSPSESPLMKCSHTAPNIVPAKIMKYDASTLFGLQAPLTLIQLCSTSKGSISVILWCPQPLKSSQFSGEWKEWFIKKASNFPPAIHLQKFTLRDTFFWNRETWFLVFCLFFRVEKLTTTDRWSFPELQSDVLFPLCSIWHLCRHTHGGSMPSLKRVKGISQVPEFLSSCWKTPDSLHYGIPTAAYGWFISPD